jgi:hypothetical protein
MVGPHPQIKPLGSDILNYAPEQSYRCSVSLTAIAVALRCSRDAAHAGGAEGTDQPGRIRCKAGSG